MDLIITEQRSHFSKGWYHFAFTSTIKKNKIYTFNYFDTSLICFRNSQGDVNIFNAYCPHLGAHLGVGGKLKKDQLICPFHGWKYNSLGECVEIPYCNKIPRRAKLQRHLVKEQRSFIFIYFDPLFETSESQLELENELKILAQFSFKKLSTTQMEISQFHQFINMAKSKYHFKSYGSNFSIVDNNTLITATPINPEIQSINFAGMILNTFNPIKKLLNQIKMRKQSKSLMSRLTTL